MPRCLIENATDKPLEVAIEPWAQLEILRPGERIYVECDHTQDGAYDIEFAAQPDGSICVGTRGEWVKITAADGRVRSYG